MSAQTTTKPKPKLAPELAPEAMGEDSVLALITNKRAFGGVVASALVVDEQGQAIDTNDPALIPVAGATTPLQMYSRPSRSRRCRSKI